MKIGPLGTRTADVAVRIEAMTPTCGRLNIAAAGHFDNAAGGRFTRFLRRFAGAHCFDHPMAGGDAEDFLADAGGAGGADGVIHIEASTEMGSR